MISLRKPGTTNGGTGYGNTTGRPGGYKLYTRHVIGRSLVSLFDPLIEFSSAVGPPW